MDDGSNDRHDRQAPLAILVLPIALACQSAGQEAVAPKNRLMGAPAGETSIALFESKVRPILVEQCYRCHGPESGEGKAKLRIDSLESLLSGGVSGPAIVRGEPDQSLLILAVRHEGEVSMPPKQKLVQREIDALVAWVKMGAPWPASAKGPAPTSTAESLPEWNEPARQCWAFQIPRAPTPPMVVDREWPRSPIDRFILARLEAAGLRPAPPADKRKLLRRATLDLLGIPPSSGEMDAFLTDDSAQDFERVVDRLLASPRYGERWGRHWLDVARYADSNGMDDNLAYSDAWRYRDYVIASLNSDKPFNRFLEEQIAGDLLAESEPSRRDALIVATGFLAIGPKMLAEDDPVKQKMDIVDEQLDTTCRVFLGLTMGCARCHDHKFDPLAMSDYYAMAGIFQSTQTMLSHRVDSKWNTTALGGSRAMLRLEDLEQIIDRHDNALVNGNTNAMTADERTAHGTLLDEAKKEYASIPKAMAVAEGKVGDLAVFLRGNHLTRGPVVARRLPTILAGVHQTSLPSRPQRPARAGTMADEPAESARGAGHRRIASGAGISARDWSARLTISASWASCPHTRSSWIGWPTQFVSDGWLLKTLHKRMLMSRAYQMSTAWNERAAQIDPENRLLWRMPRRRMAAEELRDAILAVSGQLDTTMGGTLLASVPFQDLSVTGVGRDPRLYLSTRRSVYLPVLRSALYDVFQAFDFPDPAVLNGDRASTTVASQALFMMNSPIVGCTCESLADSLLNDPGLSDRDRLQRTCQRIFGRPARPEEVSEWESFLDRYQSAASLTGESPERRCRSPGKDSVGPCCLPMNSCMSIEQSGGRR